MPHSWWNETIVTRRSTEHRRRPSRRGRNLARRRNDEIRAAGSSPRRGRTIQMGCRVVRDGKGGTREMHTKVPRSARSRNHPPIPSRVGGESGDRRAPPHGRGRAGTCPGTGHAAKGRPAHGPGFPPACLDPTGVRLAE